MPLFDSHCHLPHHKYPKPTERVISDARAADVLGIVAVGTSLNENKQAIAVADAYQGVYCSVGIHVDEDRKKTMTDLEQALQEQLRLSSKIVAIGECGIDISEGENARPFAEQEALFEMQIQLALNNNLPIIIHNRNGDESVLKLLKRYAPKGLRAIAHSFSQTWEFAQQLLDLGLFISFSGMITYKGRKGILETVKNVPMNRMLIESDAPYLPPEGFRGKSNEPKNVVVVAQKIVDVRSESLETITNQTYENAKTVFRIHLPTQEVTGVRPRENGHVVSQNKSRKISYS